MCHATVLTEHVLVHVQSDLQCSFRRSVIIHCWADCFKAWLMNINHWVHFNVMVKYVNMHETFVYLWLQYLSNTDQHSTTRPCLHLLVWSDKRRFDGESHQRKAEKSTNFCQHRNIGWMCQHNPGVTGKGSGSCSCAIRTSSLFLICCMDVLCLFVSAIVQFVGRFLYFCLCWSLYMFPPKCWRCCQMGWDLTLYSSFLWGTAWTADLFCIKNSVIKIWWEEKESDL